MTDLCERVPSYVRAIAPYQPCKPIAELERELGITQAVKLASNENPRGPSPRALRRVADELTSLARYPDGNGFELKAALAQRWGVEREGIVLGNGSNDVLDLVARTFLAPGASSLYAQHSFAVYALVTQACGAVGRQVPARAYGHDLPAMAAAIRPDTRVIFLANPNNPTGTFLPAAELQAFLRQVPPDVLVVLDEAYGEYLPEHLRMASERWLAEWPNLIVVRTFSKAYGLAGLRVGYGLAHPDVADLLNRVRQPFNVNSLALGAACAALEDASFIEESFALNRAGLAQLTDGASRLGLSHIPSVGNFVAIRVGRDAAPVYQALLRAGVIVRPVANYEMPEYLRVTVGLEEENARFLRALEKTLEELA